MAGLAHGKIREVCPATLRAFRFARGYKCLPRLAPGGGAPARGVAFGSGGAGLDVFWAWHGALDVGERGESCTSTFLRGKVSAGYWAAGVCIALSGAGERPGGLRARGDGGGVGEGAATGDGGLAGGVEALGAAQPVFDPHGADVSGGGEAVFGFYGAGAGGGVGGGAGEALSGVSGGGAECVGEHAESGVFGAVVFFQESAGAGAGQLVGDGAGEAGAEVAGGAFAGRGAEGAGVCRGHAGFDVAADLRGGAAADGVHTAAGEGGGFRAECDFRARRQRRQRSGGDAAGVVAGGAARATGALG